MTGRSAGSYRSGRQARRTFRTLVRDIRSPNGGSGGFGHRNPVAFVARLGSSNEHVAPDPGGSLTDIATGAFMASRNWHRLSSEPATPVGTARAASENLEQASDSLLIDLISQGSLPAFAALFDRTSGAVRAELASLSGTAAFSHVLASSYLEVWWLAGCHRAPGIDATSWIISIVRRRLGEALRAMPGSPRPSYSELEMAALLRRPVSDLSRE